MKETDLAYSAGFFDGEGCVYIQRATGHDRLSPNYRLVVSLGQTDPLPLNWLKERFGGSIVFIPSSAGHRDNWILQMNAKAAINFLLAIKPYCLLKLPQVELAIEYQTMIDRTTRKGRRPVLSQDQIDLREWYRQRLKALKKMYSGQVEQSKPKRPKLVEAQAVIPFSGEPEI